MNYWQPNLPKPAQISGFVYQKELIKGHYYKDFDTR